VNDALNLVGQQRTFYGNVMSQLNSQETFLQQETVNIQSQQNTLVGADTATAATELVQAATANNAALAAAARVLPNTLLDYLK
jgi:flagellin-like hook-associated protein FlgL